MEQRGQQESRFILSWSAAKLRRVAIMRARLKCWLKVKAGDNHPLGIVQPLPTKGFELYSTYVDAML